MRIEQHEEIKKSEKKKKRTKNLDLVEHAKLARQAKKEIEKSCEKEM